MSITGKKGLKAQLDYIDYLIDTESFEIDSRVFLILWNLRTEIASIVGVEQRPITSDEIEWRLDRVDVEARWAWSWIDSLSDSSNFFDGWTEEEQERFCRRKEALRTYIDVTGLDRESTAHIRVKEALEATGGDVQKAVNLFREWMSEDPQLRDEVFGVKIESLFEGPLEFIE